MATHEQAATPGVAEEPAEPLVARPQSLMLTFFAIYVLGRPIAVYSGSIIDVFGRLGISEQAVRSILARMVKRDLLQRHRRGRKIYLGLTPRSVAALTEGDRRVWGEAVNHNWDGTWTLVGFSLPESWRSQRHELRSRLGWGGFGPLQHGLWISPGRVDVPALLDGLGLDEYLNVFTAQTGKPTEEDLLVRNAFDVNAIAGRYLHFLGHWDPRPALPESADDLSRQLLLHTNWLQLVRMDPRLPVSHLPADWPAGRAQEVFRSRDEDCSPSARAIVEATVDTIDLDQV